MRDTGGRVAYANGLAQAFFGPLGPLGEGPRFVDEDGNPLGETAAGAWFLGDGESRRNQVVGVVGGDGSTRWLRAGTMQVIDDGGRVTAAIDSAVDVTDLVQTKRERVASERWRRLVADSPTAIITTDVEGRVLTWNAAAERMFGWEAEVVAGSALPWVPPDERLRSLERLRRVAQAGATETFEAERVTEDGGVVRILGSVAALPTTADGAPPELLHNYTDMTVYTELEGQRETVGRLRERVRIAMDLHDGVIQELYGLQLSLSATALESSERAGAVRRAASKLGEVIDDIRGYVLDLRAHQPAGLSLEESLRRLADEIQSNGELRVHVRVRGQAAVVPARAHAEVMQIAREATSNTVRHARATVLNIDLSYTRDAVSLTVRDDGIGFDATRSMDRAGGTTNMRMRAAAVGGWARVGSAPGKGTVVRVRIPVSGVEESGGECS